MTREAIDGTRGKATRVQDLLARRHLEELLDEALEETFPASDSIAVDFGPLKSHDFHSGCVAVTGQHDGCTTRAEVASDPAKSA
jgi:hypothetical protein